jgi:hypothetical protein
LASTVTSTVDVARSVRLSASRLDCEEHNSRRDGLTTFRKQAIEHMAHIVQVNGTYSEVEGQKAIYVQGTVKKK